MTEAIEDPRAIHMSIREMNIEAACETFSDLHRGQYRRRTKWMRDAVVVHHVSTHPIIEHDERTRDIVIVHHEGRLDRRRPSERKYFSARTENPSAAAIDQNAERTREIFSLEFGSVLRVELHATER